MTSKSHVIRSRCERFHFQLLSLVLFVMVLPGFLSCSRDNPSEEDAEQGAATIEADELLAHTRVLSSDEFEGRAPGTRGETLTVEYLMEEFEGDGLQPGNPDGTYVQEVPLIEITPRLEASFRVGNEPLGLTPPEDFVAHSLRAVPEVRVEDSELVFVGYGVEAPEYGWDDFKGRDLEGKTLLMLVNDPQVPDSENPDSLDDSIFNGRAMTYYGRWTYKYEVATEKGAAAAIVIHETDTAGYPYEVVSRDFGLPQFDIQREDQNLDRVAVEGWMSRDAAERLFQAAGLDFGEMKQAALARDFEPVSLGGSATFTVRNQLRAFESKNVVARVEGSDPARRDEHVVYVAHWDHLGKDPRLEGDQIFNGALDNATGTAGLLELGEAFGGLSPAPGRSVLFLAVTAEEFGLLGAKYYVTDPLYPLEKTVAVINMDGLNQWGPTSDIVVVGYGNSTLDDVIEKELERVGRTVRPDPEPEKGFFYRSDHFQFARRGVPALYPDAGIDFLDRPEAFGKRKREEYTANDYHRVSDEVKPDWDLSGAVEDLRILFRVGLEVANGEAFPEWNPGTEFKAVREEMLAKE